MNISRTTVIKITVFGILFYQLLDKEYVEYILEQSLQNLCLFEWFTSAKWKIYS